MDVMATILKSNIKLVTDNIQDDVTALETLTSDMKEVSYRQVIECIKETQRSMIDNLQRIRKRTRIYDANFRKLSSLFSGK